MRAAVSRLGGTSRLSCNLKPLQKEAVITKNNVRIFPEVLMCGDITMATPCTDLSRRHSVNQIGTLWLHSTIATVTRID